jgi:hypothetical protein
MDEERDRQIEETQTFRHPQRKKDIHRERKTFKYKEADINIDIQMDRKTQRLKYRQTDIYTEKQTCRQTYRFI